MAIHGTLLIPLSGIETNGTGTRDEKNDLITKLHKVQERLLVTRRNTLGTLCAEQRKMNALNMSKLALKEKRGPQEPTDHLTPQPNDRGPFCNMTPKNANDISATVRRLAA
jgi:hypothetical protein